MKNKDKVTVLTPEQKLNHLKDYLYWKINDQFRVINIWQFWGESGILILDRSGYAPNSFEDYLKYYIQY